MAQGWRVARSGPSHPNALLVRIIVLEAGEAERISFNWKKVEQLLIIIVNVVCYAKNGRDSGMLR